MAFRDLDEFLFVPPLELPVRGNVYAFPGEISADSWLKLQRLTDQQRQLAAGGDLGPGEEPVSRDDQLAIEAEIFGDIEQRMIADGCTSSQIMAVLATATAFYLNGRAAALATWDAQGESPAPNRAARRKAAPKTSTPSRGSRAGSTSRQKPRPVTSAGTTSSDTGS
jgi:hypothetical protein